MNRRFSYHIILFTLFVMFLLSLINCGGNGGPAIPGGPVETSTITIKWNANHETLVNTSGGGFRVYYSKSPGFSPNDPGVWMKDVQYVSGPQSPTSTTLTLENGTWYIRVCAYMDLNGVTVSEPSAEKIIILP